MHAPPPSALPDLNPKPLDMLAAAGLHSRVDLVHLRSIPAFWRHQATGQKTTMHRLWTHEGALTGEDRRTVAHAHRTRLLRSLEAPRTGRP